jgi:ribonuclease HI
MSKYIYAVQKGFIPGVYPSWDEAHRQVNGYSSAKYKKFPHNEQEQAYEFVGIPLPGPVPVPVPVPVPTALPKPIFKMKPVIIKKKTIPVYQPRVLSRRELAYFNHLDYVVDVGALNVYTDGSTVNNGKKNATGGYGVFFAHKEIPYISQTLNTAKVTNNIAELKGMIEALKVICKLKEDRITIYYDSEYAAGVITGRTNAHANLELVTEGKSLLSDARLEGKVIKFIHVYSHTGDNDIHSIGNEIVDDLAKRIPLG